MVPTIVQGVSFGVHQFGKRTVGKSPSRSSVASDGPQGSLEVQGSGFGFA